MGVRSPEPRCRRAAFLRGSGGESVSWLFPASRGCPHSLACGLILLHGQQHGPPSPSDSDSLPSLVMTRGPSPPSLTVNSWGGVVGSASPTFFLPQHPHTRPKKGIGPATAAHKTGSSIHPSFLGRTQDAPEVSGSLGPDLSPMVPLPCQR